MLAFPLAAARAPRGARAGARAWRAASADAAHATDEGDPPDVPQNLWLQGAKRGVLKRGTCGGDGESAAAA